MNGKLTPETLRAIALNEPPDEMTNREYWLRTEMVTHADAWEVREAALLRVKQAAERADASGHGEWSWRWELREALATYKKEFGDG